MTDAELDAIEARVSAATPGPWHWRQNKNFGLAEPTDYFDNWRLGGSPTNNLRVLSADKGAKADAEFIAHAREDIPTLLAEVRRLRTLILAFKDQGIDPPAAESNR